MKIVTLFIQDDYHNNKVLSPFYVNMFVIETCILYY